MQIWAIGTIRNEVDLVEINVRHHLGHGVDRFLLLDNDSTDGTRDVLADLARAWPVEWRPYSGAFRQHQLLSVLADEARRGGADWVMPIDADEFWWAPSGSIREILQDHEARALRVQVVNFIQQRSERHTTPASLLGMTRRTGAPVGPVERGEQLVETQQIAYVEHLYQPKWVSRALPGLALGWGNHTMRGPRELLHDTDALVCLHAPLRSFAVLEAKVDVDRPAADIDEYFDMAWHLRRWRRLAWEGRLEAEWRANSYQDDRLDVFGSPHDVIADDRLRRLTEPLIRQT